MSKSEIKDNLHHLIDKLNESSLEAAWGIMNDFKTNSEIYNSDLSEAEIHAVAKGREAVKNGQFVSLNDFLKHKPTWSLK